MSLSPFCRACGAPIEWHPTATGSFMPIDPSPTPAGVFAFNGRMQLARAEVGSRPRMYVCHWDVCAKGAKPEAAPPCDREGCDRKDRHRHCFKCGSTWHLASDCEGAAA